MSEMRSCDLTVSEAQMLCLKQHIPFFSYQLPKTSGTHFGVQLSETVSRFDGFANGIHQDGFIIAPFDTKGELPSLYIREDIGFDNVLSDPEKILKLRTACFQEKKSTREETDVTWQEYSQQVKGLIAALKEEQLMKMILSRSITLAGEALDKAPCVFEKMTRSYPDAFVFLISIPGVLAWMGATPETFLNKTQEGVSTMSLAGTMPVKQEEEPILWEYKDRKEQQIVSDYIESVLTETCGGNIRTNGPFTQRAGNVWHLCTTFTCKQPLPGKSLDILIERLHPTPAVGGFPKDLSMQFIRTIEKHDRRYYGGYLGSVEKNGNCRLFVNLRSMELFSDAWRIYVGGGITQLSEPEKEWEETEIKSQTLLSCING